MFRASTVVTILVIETEFQVAYLKVIFQGHEYIRGSIVMTIDLNTNGQALSSAVHCVLDGKWPWVIFGYMGLTHTLDVKDQGHDLNEFLNGFSAEKVLYGFIRLEVTTPAKFVLIVWQGEASSESFKIACARHIDCIKRLCRTVHVTINARSEVDLDWNEIVTKVRNLTGSVCNTQPIVSDNTDSDFIPTGSVYVRANPNKDIPKGCVSKSIWQSQQHIQDSSKLISNVKASKPVFVRPICETKTDFDRIQCGNRLQHVTKQASQNEGTNTIKNRIKALESNLPSNEKTSNYQKVDPRAEIMLARQLSNSLSMDDKEDDTSHVGTCYKKQDPRSEILAARACKQPHESIFNVSEPVGTNYKRPDVQTEIHAAKDTTTLNATNNAHAISPVNKKSEVTNNSSSQNSSYQNHQQLPSQQPQQQISSPPLALSPVVHISDNRQHPNNVSNGDVNTYNQNNSVSPQNSMHKLVSSCCDSVPTIGKHQKPKENASLQAVCLYDYVANENDELSFRVGDHIFGIEQIDEGWWLGRDASGQIGLFPANYVKLLT
ncbi:Protein kinase C and casein kinase substrate in neurons protein 1 [Schistosoma japonicum]|nr:Protein kinase C and casein kinase substrate in neurons protein 1 [Schistosoma japonicum]